MDHERDAVIEMLEFQLQDSKDRSAKNYRENCRLKAKVADLQKENDRLTDEIVRLRNEKSKLLQNSKYYRECKKKLQEEIDSGYNGTVIFNGEVD